MESYEAIFIFKPDLTKDSLDKVLKQVQDVIVKHKGSSVEIKDWGKQKLAYPITKCKEGFYYLINFHIDTDAVSKIRSSFNLNESILRVLITRS